VTQLGLLTADGSAPAERGRVHVHFGDWREAEPSWPRPFVFVSDVPYGVDYKSGWSRPESLPASIKGDKDTAERDAIMSVAGWSAAAIFGPKRVDRVPPWGDPDDLLIWDGMAGGMGDLRMPWAPSHDTIAIYGQGWRGRRSSDVLRFVNANKTGTGSVGAKRHHPHEKPLPLVCELVSKAPPGLPIVDPFMGSGTMAVACALLGREFYGAEIDPQYWPVIRGRLAAVGVVLP
jgi:hypothetical protein